MVLNSKSLYGDTRACMCVCMGINIWICMHACTCMCV